MWSMSSMNFKDKNTIIIALDWQTVAVAFLYFQTGFNHVSRYIQYVLPLLAHPAFEADPI